MKKIERYTGILVISVLFITVLFSNSACTKIDTPPMLEITVLDADGKPCEGITVGLFDSLDEWSMLENPVQAWKETDLQGRVRFIDLKENIYYFYADGDSVNNLGDRMKLDVALKINEIRQITVFVE